MARELQEVLNKLRLQAPKPRADSAAEITVYGVDYAQFCQRVKKLTAIDLGSYKGQQMHRRLDSYRARQGMPDFVALGNAVQRDSEKLKALVDFLTINVSEFFRNQEQWDTLREKILPLLMENPLGGLKAWSAGSSCGQEAYSLAMMLCEMGAHRSAILGTDIDEPSLKKAEEGVYTREEAAGIPSPALAEYCVPEGTGFRAGNTIRRMVTFGRLNLLSDEYPHAMDLVLCRNVLIYFTEKGKDQVVHGLVDSLRPGGVLFTGATEAIFNPAEFGLAQIQPFFYRRGKYETGRR